MVLDSQGRYGPWRARALKKLRANPDYELVFEREGVLVFRRVGRAMIRRRAADARSGRSGRGCAAPH